MGYFYALDLIVSIHILCCWKIRGITNFCLQIFFCFCHRIEFNWYLSKGDELWTLFRSHLVHLNNFPTLQLDASYKKSYNIVFLSKKNERWRNDVNLCKLYVFSKLISMTCATLRSMVLKHIRRNAFKRLLTNFKFIIRNDHSFSGYYLNGL